MGRLDTGPAGARTGAGCRVPSPPAAGRGLIASVCVWLLSSSKCVSHAYKQSCLKMQTTEVSANYIKCIDHRFSPNSVMFLFYIAAASCGPSAFLAADSEIHPNAPRLPGGRAGLRVGSDAPSARTAPCRGAQPGPWLVWRRFRRWRAPFPTRCETDGKAAVLSA